LNRDGWFAFDMEFVFRFLILIPVVGFTVEGWSTRRKVEFRRELEGVTLE